MVNKNACFHQWVNGFLIFAMLFPWVPSTALFADSTIGNMDVRVRYLQWPTNEVTRAETLYLSKDTSQVLRFDRNIARTAISNPEFCDFTPLSTKEILICAKKPGLANLIVWDDKDKVASYDVYSVLDTEKLKDILKNIDPDNAFRVVPFNETVAVYGMTNTAAKLKQINQAVSSYDVKAISFVTLKDPKQILLEVRFAEITRSGAENYGLDLETVISTQYHTYDVRTLYGGNAVNSTNPATAVRPSPSASGFGPVTGPIFGDLDSTSNANIVGTIFGKNISFSPILQWLENKNILKIIARPNLLAKDGEEAKFLVGGEFPVPLQTATTTSIEYKSYGTQLNFTPDVLEGDLIRLKVKTEVSELDYANVVSLGGNTVPSIIKRQHETVSELKDGETLMVGGMITQRITEVQKKLPFFGDIPGLKFLFQNKSYARTDIELVVIITPHIVSPFELREKKKFFTPEVAKKLEEGAQVYQPGFHDLQADSINKAITQGEERADFSEWRQVRDNAISEDVKVQREMTKGSEKLPTVVSLPAMDTPAAAAHQEMESALTQVNGASAVQEATPQLSVKANATVPGNAPFQETSKQPADNANAMASENTNASAQETSRQPADKASSIIPVNTPAVQEAPKQSTDDTSGALAQEKKSTAVAKEEGQPPEKRSLWSRISSLWKNDDDSSDEEPGEETNNASPEVKTPDTAKSAPTAN